MDVLKCVADICKFPIIYNRDNKAPIKILEDCGYYELHEEVTIDKILEYLNENSSLIDHWIQYSYDIRWSPVWSFGSERKNLWTVKYFDRNGLVETRTFDNKFEACASMIKLTAEEIRK